MVGLAAESQGQTRLADDRRDRRDVKALGFENRALLDVHLDEAEHVAIERCVADLARVEPEVANCLSQRDAVRIFECQQRGSKRPATARLPMKGTPNRTPSSSENAMTSMGSGRLSSCARITHSSARATPSTPS